jgi:cation transport ATPase
MSPAAERGGSAEGRRGRKPSSAKKSASRPPKKSRRSAIRLDRLRSGEAIALVAAILLFVLMFFTWFGTSLEKAPQTLQLIGPFDTGGNAWQALEVIPLFLMLAIVVAVGAALLRLLGSDWKPAIPAGAAVCVLGLLAAVLILIRIISPPGAGPEVEGFAYESTLKLPIFIALVAALGIAYGGWRAMGQEGTSFAGIAKRLESPRPPRPKSAGGAKPSGRTKS